MRMELAGHLTHRSYGLRKFGLMIKSHLRHCVDDSPLNRFKPISNVGQRTVVDHIHRIVEVCLFRIRPQRYNFDISIGIQHHRFPPFGSGLINCCLVSFHLKPRTPVVCSFFCKHHIHRLLRFAVGVNFELHQSPGIRGHGSFA